MGAPLRHDQPAPPRPPAELLARGSEAFLAGHYDEVLALAAAARSAGEPTAVAGADNLAGGVHLERGDYLAAVQCYSTAEAAFREAGDVLASARARLNLGLVHWRIDDLPRAHSDFLDALAVFEQHDQPRMVGNALNSLGLVADARGDRTAAITYYTTALPLLQAAGDRVFEANVRANLADAYESLGDVTTAWRYAEEALALRIASGHRRGLAGSRVSLARLALARGEHPRVHAEIDAGLADVHALGLQKQLADLLDVAAQLAAAERRWAEAYALSRWSAERRAALQGDEQRRRIAELRAGVDITEARRRVEAQLRENEALRAATEAAEAASRARSEFVAVVSHEIRTPLSAVVGALDLLASQPLAPPQSGWVATARGSADALLALVGDVLDLARIDAGQLTLEPAPVALAEVLEQSLAGVRARAEAKGLTLALEVAPEVPDVGWCDGPRLRQILLNLLSNAVKFTPAGGVVLSAQSRGGQLRLQVRDTGIGIAEEVLPRLFQPFVQADSSTTRRYGGTGLGLSIVRRLANALGGTVHADATPGHGATFTVDLPFPIADRPAPRPARRDRRSGHAVLLVDDDDELSEVLVQLLAHLGCRPTRAASAAEALHRLRESAYDAVLLDVHMPEVDGYALARAIRADHGASIPLTGLSGAASPDDRARGLAAGMDDYLTKPVSLERLRQWVDGLPSDPRLPAHPAARG
jgi:signal transduction histidine kinase/CheY-like chemotaxis protein